MAKEIKRSMEEFGKPLIVISNNKPSRGVGLFNLITTKNKTTHNLPAIEKINLYDKKKYSMWLYCYEKLNQIEKIIDNTDEFLVLSGFFDDQIKCWRLIVAQNSTSKNKTKLEKDDSNEQKNKIQNNEKYEEYEEYEEKEE